VTVDSGQPTRTPSTQVTGLFFISEVLTSWPMTLRFLTLTVGVLTLAGIAILASVLVAKSTIAGSVGVGLSVLSASVSSMSLTLAAIAGRRHNTKRRAYEVARGLAARELLVRRMFETEKSARQVVADAVEVPEEKLPLGNMLPALVLLKLWSEEDVATYRSILVTRNALVHGGKLPPETEVRLALAKCDELTRKLSSPHKTVELSGLQHPHEGRSSTSDPHADVTSNALPSEPC
jgi:hypothetical protein